MNLLVHVAAYGLTRVAGRRVGLPMLAWIKFDKPVVAVIVRSWVM